MKYVIVLAGHREQFKAFVKTVIAKNIFIHDHPNSVVMEGVTFMHVTSELQLRGFTLGQGSELIKVGTWYELPTETITKIEEQFHARCRQIE